MTQRGTAVGVHGAGILDLSWGSGLAKLRTMRHAAIFVLLLIAGCGAKVSDGDDGAASGTGRLTSVAVDEPARADGCTTYRAPDVCRSVADAMSASAAECRDHGAPVAGEWSFTDSCGTDAYRNLTFACCPAPASTPGCPASPTDWAPGTTCSGLVCNYVDDCGNVDQFHCKGGWASNTWTYCAGKKY